VAAAVIDLGVVGEWAPPERSRPGVRERRRWWGAARLAVVALAVALLAGDVPRAPVQVLRIPHGVFSVVVGGGRLYVTRTADELPQRIEARTAGGRLLWTVPLELNEHVTLATERVVVLSNRIGSAAFAKHRVVVRDAATGAELWRRDGVDERGVAAGRIVLQYTGDRPASTPETRIIAVDERTGALAWTVVTPYGAAVELLGGPAGWSLSSFTELGTDGALTTRDLTTGAIVRRERLELSGAAAGFSTRLAGYVLVTARSGFAGEAYDRATGRLLWRQETSVPAWLFECGLERWCTGDGDGVRAYDARTGRRVWDVAAYNEIFALNGDTVLVGGLGTSEAPSHDPVLFVVDARTGAIRRRIDGWGASWGSGVPIVVARPSPDGRTGLVGVLNPDSGGIVVLGRTSTSVRPHCSAGAGVVACPAPDGSLTVWKLP
jgi:outer membrane protein assembly factor BamB